MVDVEVFARALVCFLIRSGREVASIGPRLNWSFPPPRTKFAVGEFEFAPRPRKRRMSRSSRHSDEEDVGARLLDGVRCYPMSTLQFITSTKAAESPLKRLRGVKLAEQPSIFLLDLDAQGPDQRAVFLVFAFDLGVECLGR